VTRWALRPFVPVLIIVKILYKLVSDPLYQTFIYYVFMTNFNSQRVKIVNEINIKLGLPELIIGTPSKLIGEL